MFSELDLRLSRQLVAGLVLNGFAGIFLVTGAERPLYLDPRQPVEMRVEDLLSRMRLEEKVGQMNMPVHIPPLIGKSADERREGFRRMAAGTYLAGIGPFGGFFAMAHSTLRGGPRQQAEFFNELQRIAIEKTRLKIPLLQTEEGTHGLMCSGGTIFPAGPTLGSTWNMELIERIYAATAVEARAVGIHQIFTLVIEPIRDPRLGRNVEAYSECPFMCARIAEAIVRGAQGGDVSASDKVVAGLAHFPGQSQPVSGLERGAVEISERTLRQVFLPPWIAGVKAGALGVMATYPSVDSVPAHASHRLLTKILREEMGFQGLVLEEGGGINTLVAERVAAGPKDAGQLVLKAGVDIGITFSSGYLHELVESVREGFLPVELIDCAVRRILTQKFRLGLFESPYVDTEYAAEGVDRGTHRQLALEAAREGIVLLKNENNLLPLRKTIRSVAVIGPNADHGRNLLGDFTSRTVLQHVVTILEGIKGIVSPVTDINYVKGCNILGEEINEIARAAETARDADVAVVVVGETVRGGSESATTGEGLDVASFDLTGLQEELVKAVYATGTPTVVVLVNGRPLSIRWISEHVPAIVEAWHPGEMGGLAVAEILFGDYNPNGRLPVTVPRHVGQLPVYYNYQPSKLWYIDRRQYVDMSRSPLYEFGYGLSYTTFAYDDLTITPSEIRPVGRVQIGFSVRNTGQLEGAEVVQLYVDDVLSSVTTPVKELRRFKKVWLKPGEQTRVEFYLTSEDLALLDMNLKPVVEPGAFEVMVGASSEDIRLKGVFRVR